MANCTQFVIFGLTLLQLGTSQTPPLAHPFLFPQACAKYTFNSAHPFHFMQLQSFIQRTLQTLHFLSQIDVYNRYYGLDIKILLFSPHTGRL